MSCHKLCGFVCDSNFTFLVDQNTYTLQPCGELSIGLFLFLFQIFYIVYQYTLNSNELFRQQGVSSSIPRCGNILQEFYKLRLLLWFLINLILIVEFILMMTYRKVEIQAWIVLQLFQTFIACFKIINFKSDRVVKSIFIDFAIFLMFVVQIYDNFMQNQLDVHYASIITKGHLAISIFCYSNIVLLIIDRLYEKADDQLDLLIDPEVILNTGHENTNFLSRLSFYWTNNLMLKGYKRQLIDIDRLYRLPNELSTKNLCQKLTDKLIDPKFKKSIIWSLNSAFGCEFYWLGLIRFFCDVLNFSGPLLLGFIVDSIQQKDSDPQKLYIYAGVVFFSTLVRSVLDLQYAFRSSIISLKIRAAIVGQVYEKILKIPQSSLHSRFSSGEISNFVSIDADRVSNVVRSFHDIWSLPMQICIALYMLYREVIILVFHSDTNICQSLRRTILKCHWSQKCYFCKFLGRCSICNWFGVCFGFDTDKSMACVENCKTVNEDDAFQGSHTFKNNFLIVKCSFYQSIKCYLILFVFSSIFWICKKFTLLFVYLSNFYCQTLRNH